MFRTNLLITEENLAWRRRQEFSPKIWCTSAKVRGSMLQYNFWDVFSLPPKGTPARVMNVNKCNWPARFRFSSPSACGARRVARILLAAERLAQELDDVLFLSKHRERDLQMYADVDPNPRPQGVSKIKEQQGPTFFCAQATSGRHLLFGPLFLFYFTFHYSFYIVIFLFFFLSHASSLPIPCLIFIFPFSLLRCTHTQPCFNFTYSCHLFINLHLLPCHFGSYRTIRFPHYFICHCIRKFYRILSTSIYFMLLVPSVLNPISTFLIWYSLVQPLWIFSVLTVTSLRSALFSVITQRAAVISYRRFGTT
jgi:hypothetical protein